MTKLIGALIIFVVVLMILGARRSFGGATALWKKAKALADEKDKEITEDTEFDEKHRHFRLFLDAQELMLAMGGKKPSFANEREKLRYLHFVLGAIDQLSRTIKDEERSGLWSWTASTAQAILLFPALEATKHYVSYGRTGDPELHRAGERGWNAMRMYILSAVGKASESDFQKSCTELFYVVRGADPREP